MWFARAGTYVMPITRKRKKALGRWELLAIALGSLVFIVSVPFSALGGNTQEAFEEMVKKPARYTFKRQLGDF